MARPCCLGFWYSVPTAVMRRRVAQGAAEKEAQMFEALAEFLRFPPVPSNAACPRSGSTNPARLSFGYFALAKCIDRGHG